MRNRHRFVPATVIAVALTMSLPGGVLAQPATTGSSTDLTVRTADGRDRTAHLYVPATLPDRADVPLLVALHGGTGWGKQFEFTSGSLADEHGFIVVYPDGIGIGPEGDRVRTWNGGVCCGPAAREDVDDVGFLRMLVETISETHRIDPERVFATGHSNGMIMSYRLVCDAADVFVAAAGQAGTLAVDECAPAEPVSLRHIHGTADTNLPVDGGRGSTSIADIDFPSPKVGIRALAEADGCPRRARTKVAGPVTTRTWKPCDDRTVIQFVSIDGANHGWMGGPPSPRPGAPEPFADYDSSESVWKFLAKHPRQ